MSSLTNIDRDSLWYTNLLVTARQSWPATDFRYNSDGAVYDHIASVKSATGALTTGVGVYRSIGVNMKAPIEEYTPYRVKARLPTGRKGVIVIGYAQATITGTEDLISEVQSIPFHEKFDEIININYVDSTSTYYGRPIAITVSAEEVATESVWAFMSVQNLGVAPPSYAKGVS